MLWWKIIIETNFDLWLQEVLDIARQLLADLGQHNDCEIEEKKSKLEQLKTVLEMWVHLVNT